MSQNISSCRMQLKQVHTKAYTGAAELRFRSCIFDELCGSWHAIVVSGNPIGGYQLAGAGVIGESALFGQSSR